MQILGAARIAAAGRTHLFHHFAKNAVTSRTVSNLLLPTPQPGAGLVSDKIPRPSPVRAGNWGGATAAVRNRADLMMTTVGTYPKCQRATPRNMQ